MPADEDVMTYKCQNPKCGHEFTVDAEDRVEETQTGHNFRRKANDESSTTSDDTEFCPACGDVAEPV